MPLLELAQTTLSRLNRVKVSREGVDEAKALDERCSELLQKTAPITRLAQNANLLKNEGVRISTVPEVSSVIETVNNVSARFQELAKSTTLTQGRRWIGLTNKIDALTQKITDVQNKDWEGYFENNFFGGPHPSQRSTRLAPTPYNERAMEIYKELFYQFSKYRSKIPQDADDFTTLRNLSNKLSKISFQEDVPVAVKRFFEETSSSTGASLELLTMDVIEWLRSNNLLNNYNIRAKY